MTLLPAAHPFVPVETGRRCGSCERRRAHGLHRYQPSIGVGRVHVVPTPRYRTSGTPYMARPGIWTAAR